MIFLQEHVHYSLLQHRPHSGAVRRHGGLHRLRDVRHLEDGQATAPENHLKRSPRFRISVSDFYQSVARVSLQIKTREWF